VQLESPGTDNRRRSIASKIDEWVLCRLLALFGMPHVRHWRKCPTLAVIDGEVGGDLFTRARLSFGNGFARAVRMLPVSMSLVLLSLLLIRWTESRETVDTFAYVLVLASALLVGAVYIHLLALLLRVRRGVSPEFLPMRLINLIAMIEHRPDKWGSIAARGRINGQIEQVARLYARFGQELRAGDEKTAEDLDRWSRGLAARMRAMKLWVARPGPFTFTDVLARLSTDLRLAVHGNEHELEWQEPGPRIPSPRRSLIVKGAWASLSVLLLGATAAAVVTTETVSAASTLVISLLAAGGLMSLGQAGVPLRQLAEAKTTFDALRKEPSQKGPPTDGP
jgi:hypothetical protein